IVMIIPRIDELKQILNGHHIFNIILSLAFIITRGTVLCPYVFWFSDICEVDSREREVLMFLAVMIVWKGRKASNWLHYLSTLYMFSKLANLVLFFRADLILGCVYSILAILQMVVFPEPVYNGPENVTYFQGAELYEELTKKNGTTWIIEFYASWSPECRHIQPVFAKLSERLSLPNVKFGKLDLGRWPNEANKFYVNAAATSRQLPTICVFQDGKEVVRRPVVKNQRAVPFVFSEDNCIRELGLWEIHSKAKDAKKKGGKTDKKNN
ncbi:hypothetical protein PRIPAC_94428, partial [Pristionchus pacificus]|uniref:Thioredoxin n=1 Tax=Pristionchus pacificus TaxID=54126 RepID=A0A2A6B480_PRIPA